MSVPAPALRRPPRERLAAWLVTGPIGHLFSVVTDVAVFGGHWAAQRIVRGAGSLFSARR